MKTLTYAEIVSYLDTDKFKDSIAFNTFANRFSWTKEPPIQILNFKPGKEVNLDDDGSAIRLYLETLTGSKANLSDIQQAIRIVGKSKSFNPLTDYLDSLQWDGKDRLTTLMTDYFGATNPDLHNELGRRWMISAVARAYEPGCQADGMLLLLGAQGIGKSRSARNLAPDYFTDSKFDIDNTKRASCTLQGQWIVEIAELATMSKKEVESVKAYISSREDRYVPNYALSAITIPRAFVLVGSTNNGTCLKDPTGSRRFWTVECSEIKSDEVGKDRDQLWAQAVHCYKTGWQWHLTKRYADLLEEENTAYRAIDPWEPLLEKIIAGLTFDPSLTTELLLSELNVSDKKADKHCQSDQTRLNTCMSSIGYRKTRLRLDGGIRTCVFVKRSEAKQLNQIIVDLLSDESTAAE